MSNKKNNQQHNDELKIETKPETKSLGVPDCQQLTAALNEAENKANQYWQDLLRAKAEIENMQKRMEREIAGAHKYGLEKIIVELLPIVDSLEHGLNSSRFETDDQLTDDQRQERIKNIHDGMELTLTLFINTLKKFGVERIDPFEQEFDPHKHQAMSKQKDPEAKPNTILQVWQKGYTLHGRLVRPALVVVAE